LSQLAQPLDALLAADFGDWQALLSAWRRSAAGESLVHAVDARVGQGAAVFPSQVFRALSLTPLSQTRVLILGQDPYHGAGQAEGLSFSVPAGLRLPPSLRNILKELQRDLGQAPPSSGSLVSWAERGVLLLNASLTVEEGRPGSHAGLGWHTLTDAVCAALWADAAPKVFMLWGAHAQSRVPLTSDDRGRHCVLRSNHPSPLSASRPPRPFIGCGHFSRASDFLLSAGRGRMVWTLQA
jgi:uracil-DNA glycosylase